MAIRPLAISGLALAAALTVAQPGRAQSFFSFYEMSPRQIVGMLEDDGYEIHGPMQRRGDVYVCDVVSVSGQPVRLIVSARDGHVVGRYAERGARSREFADAPRVVRPPRDIGDDDRDGHWDDDNAPRHQMALGDLFNPPSRVYGGEAPFSSKPDSEDAPVAKPKHHAMKKHPSVAKAPPTTAPTPDAAASDKPGATPSPSVAAVAPSAPPESKKSDAVKTDAPPPAAAAPEPAQKKAETEKAPASEPTSVSSPKPDAPRKKINDLPVGTLD